MILFKFFLLVFIFERTIRINKAQNCGKYPIESLNTELYYKSNKRSEPLRIKIAQPNDHRKVHIGYYTASDGAIRCVAVKMTSSRDGAQPLISFHKNSIKIMERIQQNLPAEQRKHLIEMIDAGETMDYRESIIIMEMGVASYADNLYSRRWAAQIESDQEMLNAIGELAQPLTEFHKIAIHMDVNPNNYLFVLDNNGQLVLKLIDFDGAQSVSTSNKNECVVVHEHAYTPEYTGPEYYSEDGREISTKFDIWSLGMIVFEVLLEHFEAKKGRPPLYESVRQQQLRDIGNLFLGFTRNVVCALGAHKEAPILYSESKWIEQHQKSIVTVLQLWQKFPSTALLVANLLNAQRQKRLTAQGILDYIGGKCQIGQFKGIRKAEELPLFNSVNFGNFLSKLRLVKLVNKAKMIKANRSELNAIFKEMKRMVKKVIRELQKKIEGMEKNETAQREECATD